MYLQIYSLWLYLLKANIHHRIMHLEAQHKAIFHPRTFNHMCVKFQHSRTSATSSDSDSRLTCSPCGDTRPVPSHIINHSLTPTPITASTSTITAAGQPANAHTTTPTPGQNKGMNYSGFADISFLIYTTPNCPVGVQKNTSVIIISSRNNVYDVQSYTFNCALWQGEQLDFQHLYPERWKLGWAPGCLYSTSFLETDHPMANGSFWEADRCYNVVIM